MAPRRGLVLSLLALAPLAPGPRDAGAEEQNPPAPPAPAAAEPLAADGVPAPAAIERAGFVLHGPAGLVLTTLPPEEESRAAGRWTLVIGGTTHPAAVFRHDPGRGLLLLRAAESGLTAASAAVIGEPRAGPAWALDGAIDVAGRLRPGRLTFWSSKPVFQADGGPDAPPPAGGSPVVDSAGRVVALVDGPPSAGRIPLVPADTLLREFSFVPPPVFAAAGAAIPGAEAPAAACAAFTVTIRRAPVAPLPPSQPLPPFDGRSHAARSRSLPAPARRLDRPIEEALAWLAEHQGEDGLWRADYSSRCRAAHGALPCDGEGIRGLQAGVTGLALQAFLGMGHTDREGVHAATVRRGLDALLALQDSEGCFGSRVPVSFVFQHGSALQAVAEALGVTGDVARYGRAVDAGALFAIRCQNPRMGWRYGIRPQDNDGPTTAWMVHALWLSSLAGRPPGELRDSLEGARYLLDRLTDVEYGHVGYTARGVLVAPYRSEKDFGRYGFLPRLPGADSPERHTATAMACWARRAIAALSPPPEPPTPPTKPGKPPKPGTEAPEREIDLQELSFGALGKADFAWREGDGSRDALLCWFAALALRGEGREHDARLAAMRREIVDRQRPAGSGLRGSWDPTDPWGAIGGRTYATAALAIALQVEHRWPKLALPPRKR